MKNKKTVVSLFTGCGGLDLGFTQAGFTIVYANEIDSWAAETYRHNIGNIVVEDITKLDILSIPKADIVVGGPPCQSYSLAGKRDLNDPRSALFKKYFEVVKHVNPKAFVFENVKGLLSMQDGELITTIISLFETLGYVVHYKVLNAADYGVPQKRERVFIVGTKDCGEFKFPAPTHKKHMTVSDAFKNFSEHPLNHEPMKHTARIVERFKCIRQGQSLKDVPVEHMQRERGNSGKISGKTFSQNNYRLLNDAPSPTICASFQSNFIHPTKHRNITAREAARLQTFPDTFEFMGKRTTMSWEKNLSQYNQIGNAVPPLLAKNIALAIKKSVYN